MNSTCFYNFNTAGLQWDYRTVMFGSVGVMLGDLDYTCLETCLR